MKRASALLTIGTEITDGDILNSNAQWLSQRLFAMNWRVQQQLTVTDDRAAILEALAYLGRNHDLIVVTGGLGPTSDDLTRYVVAEHCQVPMRFDSTKWRDLEAFYRQAQIPANDGHKHQAFFPEGATVLGNANGTADGFWLRTREHDFVVLPGPPRELMPMWTSHVEPLLTTRIDPSDTAVFIHYKLLGVPESEIARPIEALLAREPNVRLGFRAQVPYVHVKILTSQETARALHGQLESVRSLVDPYLTPTLDLAEPLLTWMHLHRATILDTASNQQLAKRLLTTAAQKKLPFPSFITAASEATGALSAVSVSPESFSVEAITPTGIKRLEIAIPSRVRLRPSIRDLYVTEAAVVVWAHQIALPEVAGFALPRFSAPT